MTQTILLTGGLGYIGSHCAVELLNSGYNVIIVDNLCNSHQSTLEKIKVAADLTQGSARCLFFNIDLANSGDCRARLRAVFEVYPIVSVIHLAAYKSVPESVAEPLRYYKNNLFSLTNVLDVMDEFHIYHLIFSSSATVYGDLGGDQGALDENTEKSPTNPYGQTKWFGEEMCRAIAQGWAAEKKDVKVISLRYGNPVNARPGLPENPRGPAMNLFNVATEVLQGKREKLSIFGDDYPTPDGTGVRDFIHVMDLARAHVAALEHPSTAAAYDVFNIGIGRGYSVLDIVHGLEQVHGKKILSEVVSRRAGDVASLVFDVKHARETLGWEAKCVTIQDLCK